MTDLYIPTKPADSTPRPPEPFKPVDLWEQYLIGITGPIAPTDRIAPASPTAPAGRVALASSIAPTVSPPRMLATAPALPRPATKPWYRTPLCTLGIHRGQWDFVAEGDCTQARTCVRCAATHTRTKHRHQWQYIGKGSCKQHRACVRCQDNRGQRTHHEEWGETYTLSSSRDAHRCLRCAHVEDWSSDYDD